MAKINKIIVSILICVFTIGVGGEVLYHFNGDFRYFVNRLFHIKDTSTQIDYENDIYVVSLESEISDLEALVAQYESEDSILNNRIRELEGRVTELEAQVAELQESNRKLSSQIDSLDDEISELWDLFFDYMDDGESDDAEVVVVNKVETLETRLASLQLQYENVSRENNAKIAELNSQITTLRNEKASTQSQMNGIQSSINSNRARIAENNSRKSEYNDSLITLKAKDLNGTATKEEQQSIVELERLIKAIDDDNANLNSEITEFSARYNNLSRQLDNIEARIEKLERDVEILTAEINKLQQKISKTQSELSRIRDFVTNVINHEHIPGDAVVEDNIDPTCLMNGSYKLVVYCSDCGDVLSISYVTVPATGHIHYSQVRENEIQATCTSTGSYDLVSYCSDCGFELSRVTYTVPALGHIASEPVIENSIPATCTSLGSYDEVIYCSICGEELSRETHTVSMLEHSAKNAVIENSVPATCTSTGSYDSVVYCADCDTEISRETQIVPMLEHTASEGVIENVIPATCTTTGSYDSVVYCSECGEEVSRVTSIVSMLEHTVGEAVIENSVPATYTETGSYDVVVYCTECGEELSRETHIIPMLEHTIGEAVIENSVPATCTTTGSYDVVVYCTECGEELSRETHIVSMVEHTSGESVTENVIPATCTTTGSYDLVVYCSECGEELSRETIIVPMVEHTAGESVTENVIPATCTTTGSYDEVVYCIECNAEISRNNYVISKLNHTEDESVTENLIPSTCTTTGSYDTVVYCKDCETEISRVTHEIPLAEHTEGEVVIENSVPATCTSLGSYDEVVYCTECNTELSRETHSIPMLGHTAGESITENVVPATCTTIGSYDTVVYCSVCGEELSRESHTTPMLEHTAGEVVIENLIEATGSTTGSYDEVVYCSECGEELSRNTVIIPVMQTDYYDEATGKTFNNYYNLSETKRSVADTFLAGTNSNNYIGYSVTPTGSDVNINVYFSKDTSPTGGLWVYDKTTLTYYTGEDYFGYETDDSKFSPKIIYSGYSGGLYLSQNYDYIFDFINGTVTVKEISNYDEDGNYIYRANGNYMKIAGYDDLTDAQKAMFVWIGRTSRGIVYETDDYDLIGYGENWSCTAGLWLYDKNEYVMHYLSGDDFTPFVTDFDRFDIHYLMEPYDVNSITFRSGNGVYEFDTATRELTLISNSVDDGFIKYNGYIYFSSENNPEYEQTFRGIVDNMTNVNRFTLDFGFVYLYSSDEYQFPGVWAMCGNNIYVVSDTFLNGEIYTTMSDHTSVGGKVGFVSLNHYAFEYDTISNGLIGPYYEYNDVLIGNSTYKNAEDYNGQNIASYIIDNLDSCDKIVYDNGDVLIYGIGNGTPIGLWTYNKGHLERPIKVTANGTVFTIASQNGTNIVLANNEKTVTLDTAKSGYVIRSI